MQFNLIAAGTANHAAAVAWIADYAQRIQRFARYERKSVRAVHRARSGVDASARSRESAAILHQLPPSAFVVLLDSSGIRLDCDILRDQLQKTALDGGRTIWFVIGGPDGVDSPLAERADATWSLSPLTLPHELAEVVLLEQLYRALTRLKGLPYHR